MGEGLEYTFTQRGHSKCQQLCENMLNASDHQGSGNPKHNEKAHIPFKMDTLDW
jgi:hypothetical protein